MSDPIRTKVGLFGLESLAHVRTKPWSARGFNSFWWYAGRCRTGFYQIRYKYLFSAQCGLGPEPKSRPKHSRSAQNRSGPNHLKRGCNKSGIYGRYRGSCAPPNLRPAVPRASR